MIELHPHTAFTGEERRRRTEGLHDPASYIHPPRLLQPIDDPALPPRWHLLDESLCPLCGEVLDGPECGHDWPAIAAVEQSGTPIIDMRGNRG